MKKLLQCCIVIFLSLVYSLALAESPKTIIFFGDSLSDDGNLFSMFHIIPKSPPYYLGRFSNGFVWSDIVAEQFAVKHNFAVGGATAVYRKPFTGYMPWALKNEVGLFLAQSTEDERREALFIIWMGANDYLQGMPNVAQGTQEVVNEIGKQIKRLIDMGARNFVIFNLPDLSKAPYARTVTFAENLHNLTLAHNDKLQLKFNELQKTFPHVLFHYFDAYSTYNDMDSNPDKYNALYHTHIRNTQDSCWAGGYTIPHASRNDIVADLKNSARKNPQGTSLSSLETEQLAAAILKSPGLAEAYRVGLAHDSKETPCDRPDEYAFWDHVHPSAVTHFILGEIVMDYLVNEHLIGKSVNTVVNK